MTSIAKYFTAIILVLIINKSFGQQNIFNLYMYDMKLVNPAFAGIAEAQIFSADFQTSHTKIDDHPYAFYAGYENSLPKTKSAIGAITQYDKLGLLSEFRSNLIYNYQFKIREQKTFSVGATVGYRRFALDRSKFRAIDPDDPVLLESAHSSNSINLNFGALLLINNFKIGLSSYNLIQAGDSKHPFFPQTDDPAVNFTIENKVDLTEWLSFRPSLLYHSDFSSMRLDLNGVFEIKKLILIGGNYEIRENRDNNLNLNGGVVIKDKFQIILLAYSRNYKKSVEILGSGLNFEAMARLKFQ